MGSGGFSARSRHLLTVGIVVLLVGGLLTWAFRVDDEATQQLAAGSAPTTSTTQVDADSTTSLPETTTTTDEPSVDPPDPTTVTSRPAPELTTTTTIPPLVDGVYAIGVNGTGNKLLAASGHPSGGAPAAGPTAEVCYVDVASRLHLVSIDGGNDRVLGEPHVQPVGFARRACEWYGALPSDLSSSYLAYATWDGTAGAIHAVKPDGTGAVVLARTERSVVSFSINFGSVSWADGSSIFEGTAAPEDVRSSRKVIDAEADVGSLKNLGGMGTYTSDGAAYLYDSRLVGPEQLYLSAIETLLPIDFLYWHLYLAGGEIHSVVQQSGQDTVLARDASSFGVIDLDVFDRGKGVTIAYVDTSSGAPRSLRVRDANGGTHEVVKLVRGRIDFGHSAPFDKTKLVYSVVA